MKEPLLQDVDKIYTEELIPQPFRVLRRAYTFYKIAVARYYK